MHTPENLQIGGGSLDLRVTSPVHVTPDHVTLCTLAHISPTFLPVPRRRKNFPVVLTFWDGLAEGGGSEAHGSFKYTHDSVGGAMWPAKYPTQCDIPPCLASNDQRTEPATMPTWAWSATYPPKEVDSQEEHMRRGYPEVLM